LSGARARIERLDGLVSASTRTVVAMRDHDPGVVEIGVADHGVAVDADRERAVAAGVAVVINEPRTHTARRIGVRVGLRQRQRAMDGASADRSLRALVALRAREPLRALRAYGPRRPGQATRPAPAPEAAWPATTPRSAQRLSRVRMMGEPGHLRGTAPGDSAGRCQEQHCKRRAERRERHPYEERPAHLPSPI